MDEIAPPEARLHFVSIEAYPLARDELVRALALWPQFAPYRDALAVRWEAFAPGWHRLAFASGRVVLTLLVGDNAAVLPRLEAAVDAWVLDGFAPSRNPDMWSPAALAQLAQLSRPGTTFATYTAAGEVRRHLEAVGFVVRKKSGFGHKREMLAGTLRARVAPPWCAPWFARPAAHTGSRRAIVVGSGPAGLPVGKIGLTPGAAMAAADRVEITIDGRGGHGVHPHRTVDPVVVAGHIITAVQSIVSRNVSPIDTAVVSLCSMHAGNPGAMSVVPQHAKLVGTVHTFKPTVQNTVEQRLKELVGSIGAAFGAQATVRYERIYPATIYHDGPSAFALDNAESLVGSENVVRNLDPSMGSEDFSFMLQVKPGAFARLGQGGADAGSFLHATRYDFNDAVIPLGAGYLAALAERALPERETRAMRPVANAVSIWPKRPSLTSATLSK